MGTPYGPGQPGGWQPQQPYPQPAGYQPPAGPRYDNDKGFFGSLFDFSFDNFVAPKLIKFLYVLILVLTSVASVFWVVSGFAMMADGSSGAAVGGLFLIILSPVIWFFSVMVARVYLEMLIVMFKISEDLKDIRDSRTLQ
ncbi:MULTISPECIES: DUF4282 domain-containing protein [Thermomonospora]|uniref:DUF4282 domain-containing protein n=1 Tax=Thermomonospora curvata (strain ATCC 19995 / DSM 43183 / JCM 3096 / KCTC 9072 / NBRC 15933 / NCIMB 10081 / Henssen B9) TaxID=471852 RepID=D1A8J8_THECD|nr:MULTISPECIES: DUF4282 domain-containing protein [Thermomonospora]ACY96693.1 hypothetical protein Tcur_1108 [Thermomonospora curvata DSM 43183]PKK15486.1 MAG: DUF4282 domain-containing protein [Thermomonospora sp. CIF 1]